jgi:sugar lactone lactonase YvrE
MSNGTRVWVATHHQGKRLNSPNDLVRSWDGHLYFTDPTYGLVATASGEVVNDEEDDGVTHSGVYMVHKQDVLRSAITR